MIQQRITRSQMATLAACPRRHQIAYELRVRPAEAAKPLRFGDRFHQALDLRNRGAKPEDAIYAAALPYEEAAALVEPEDPERAYELRIEAEDLRCLLAFYFWRWSEADAALATVASEQVLTMPIPTHRTRRPMRSFRYAAKVDAVVRDESDGLLYLIEHKTRGCDIAPGSDYWQQKSIEDQVGLYMLVCRRQRKPIKVAGVIYDVARKPTIRPRQVPLLDEAGLKIVRDANGDRVYLDNGKPRQGADGGRGWTLATRRETPEEYRARLWNEEFGFGGGAVPSQEILDKYLVRRTLTRTEADLAEALEGLYQSAKVLAFRQLSNFWERATGACQSHLGRCPYFELCTRGWKPGSALPEGFVVVKDPHVELVEEEDDRTNSGAADRGRAAAADRAAGEGSGAGGDCPDARATGGRDASATAGSRGGGWVGQVDDGGVRGAGDHADA